MAELEITDVAFGGKGVARLEGKAVFVPFAIDGETVLAEVTREHKKFLEAELASVEKSSPYRVEPACPYFGSCGGCVYQHVSYEHQLELKWRQVKEILRRIGGIKDAPMRPFIPSPAEYGYRNRVTVHARDGVLGFFRRESNKLLDILRCPIAADEVNLRLAELRAQRPRDGHYTVRAPDGPHVFTQANDAVAAAMLDLVERLLAGQKDENATLIDAFCGAGFFAKRSRAHFGRVVGIDWDRHAIAIAQQTAGANETYVTGNVDEELPRYLNEKVSAVIVDPPATGLSETGRTALRENPPARLCYVSCNPATLARDLANLKEVFRLDSVTPLDMFPQTAEIEIVAALTRGG